MLTQEEFAKLPKEQQEALLKKMEEIQKSDAAIKDETKNQKQLTMEEMTEMVNSVVEKQIKSMTPVDKKHFAFPGIGEVEDGNEPEVKFAKTARFMKSLIRGDVATTRKISEEARVKANLSEGTAGSGGFLVPDEFKAEILRIAATYGVIRRECRIIPMKSDVIYIPAAGSTEQSAIWTNEAAQIKQTNPNFRQVALTINKLAALPKVTTELLEDADINIVQYLAELVGEAFAKEEDNQGFNGTGSPFTGALAATGVPTYPHVGGTGFICLSYQDIVKATGELYDSALSNAKFYFHRSMIAHIRSLITTAGAPIFPATAGMVAGYSLVSAEKLPSTGAATAATDATKYAIFGDLRKGMAMGQRGAISMKISDQATVDSDNLFEKDMAALRMIERVSIGVILPSAFLCIAS